MQGILCLAYYGSSQIIANINVISTMQLSFRLNYDSERWLLLSRLMLSATYCYHFSKKLFHNFYLIKIIIIGIIQLMWSLLIRVKVITLSGSYCNYNGWFWSRLTKQCVLGVYFTNILRAAFFYESVLCSFSLHTIWLCNFLASKYLWKSCL